MSIRVIVELQAKPGQRDALKAVMERLVAQHAPTLHGFQGSVRYEVLDQPDTLVEIADWESVEARAVHMQEASATGAYAPVMAMLAAPFRATVVRPLQ